MFISWNEACSLSVGAGAAGNVLASRLTEDETSSVLLLESGGGDDDAAIPNSATDLEIDFDHAFRTVPQERACRSMVDRVSWLCWVCSIPSSSNHLNHLSLSDIRGFLIPNVMLESFFSCYFAECNASLFFNKSAFIFCDLFLTNLCAWHLKF